MALNGHLIVARVAIAIMFYPGALPTMAGEAQCRWRISASPNATKLDKRGW